MSVLSRRTLLAAGLTTGLTAALAACTGQGGPAAPGSSQASSAPGSPSTPPELTVGLTYVPDIQFALLYVADHFGWFAEEGLAVTLRHHGAQESLLGALQTGDEDVVFAGGGEMLQARSQQVPVLNFATIYQQYPVTLIVPQDSPIQTFADLRGHSVGLPGEYGENWFYLLAALTDAGLTRDDVDIQSIGYTQHAALTGGRVDSVVGFLNNDVVRFQEAGFPIRTISLSDPPLVSVGFGALDDTVATRPTELAALLRATARGAQFCADRPEEAVQIAKDYVPNLAEAQQQAYALATLQATTPLYGDRFGHQDETRWERMATFFTDQGLVASPVPAGDAFTSEVANA